jgi:hypothetical protein
MLRVPTNPDAPRIPEWARKVATALNEMIGLVAEPQEGQVRYANGRLEHYEGGTWKAV